MSICVCHLYRDHRCQELTYTCSGEIKGNSCRPRRAIENRSVLSAPKHEEWLWCVFRLNSVASCDWSTSDFLLGHKDTDISFDRSFRMPVTVFNDSDGSDPFLREKGLDLLQRWCFSVVERLVHLFIYPLWPAPAGPLEQCLVSTSSQHCHGRDKGSACQWTEVLRLTRVL